MVEHSARLIACIPRLRRYARALLGERGAVDDLVQDTVERGWQRLASWRADGDMRAWLFAIMHNLHADQLRDQLRARGTPPPTYDGAGAMADEAAGPDAGLTLRDMDAALQQLAPEQRAVLLLVALEELSYGEVAAALGIPLGTVMSRLSRARERLRQLLQAPPSGQPGKPPGPTPPSATPRRPPLRVIK